MGIPGRREIVVLARVLTTEFTRGYQDMEDQVVLSVGGVTVRDLRHLSDYIHDVQLPSFYTFPDVVHEFEGCLVRFRP